MRESSDATSASNPPATGSWLTLPPEHSLPEASDAEATAAWSAILGGRPVLLVRDVDRARAVIMQAARLPHGAPIALPANATHGLVEATKHAGFRPAFLPLTPDLTLAGEETLDLDVAAAWLQPVGGLPPGGLPGTPGPIWVDHVDTLPLPAHGSDDSGAPLLTLWGLHLSASERESGALLVLTAPDHPLAHEAWSELRRRLRPDDRADPALALAQSRRLASLAVRWQAVFVETARGMEEAAGLEILRPPSGQASLGSLALHVAVRIPEECDGATFYAYAAGEHTPVAWLPLLRPLYHRAIADPATRAAFTATAAHLARWLLVPVDPDADEAAISQTVLGVVKAAEYLGVRWRTRPAQAAAYAALLADYYGTDHDAYRPIFAIPGNPLPAARAGD